MKNTPVDEYAAREIQGVVARVLREVDPEPPLDLEQIRDRLRLDLRYYSIEDPSLRQELVHRVKVGTVDLARKAAESLFSVSKKAGLLGLWLPWKKGSGEKSKGRILINEAAPKLKHRWIQAHEVGHSVIPHHARFLFGDPEQTLSLSCQAELEAEANYAAGQLTFLQGRFSAEACDAPMALGSVLDLSKTFGNTKTSTLWRFVEEAHKGQPLVGLVTKSPWGVQAEDPCRYCIESPAFRVLFGAVSERELFEALRGYCQRRRGGPLGEGEVLLEDGNGTVHAFRFESWSNTHDVLTLGVYAGPRVMSVRVPGLS